LVQGSQRLKYAVAIAPALGYTLLVILAFPLARYVGPVHTWAWPVTLIWIAASLLVAGLDWNKHRLEYRQALPWAPLLGAVGVSVGIGLILVSPLLLKGIQYAMFRTNPSDAFLYMSMADMLRLAPWPVIVKGSVFQADNLAGLQSLAAVAPSAL